MRQTDHGLSASSRRLTKVIAHLLRVSFDPTSINPKGKRIVDLLGLDRSLPSLAGCRCSRNKQEPANTYYITLIDEESHRSGKSAYLSSSYEKWNVVPVILNDYDNKIGNWSKIVSLHSYLLDSSHIQDHDVIVFTDATDVLAACPSPPDFPDILREYDVDILFGAENRFAKANESFKTFFDTTYADHEHRYLNSGFVMGRKRELMMFYAYLSRLLNKLKYVSLNRSDQAVIIYGFVRTLRKHHEKMRIGIDYKGKCVVTVNSITSVPAEIKAPFVHVTSQRDRRQAVKWSSVLELLGTGRR